MIIHPEAQGTLEWLLARAGVVTASEMDNLLTPEFKERTGEMRKTYMAVKVAERWLGGPLAGFMSIDMDIGRILEEEALPFFTLQTGQEVQKVGLITTEDGTVGASPDGLLGEDGGIEAKCPRAETHVKYLLAGVVPKDYIVQVHAAMFVTGRPSWTFLSYARHLPPLILKVERDEEIIEKIEAAIKPFLADMEVGFARLCEINGGPPRRIPKSSVRLDSQQKFIDIGAREADVSIP